MVREFLESSVEWQKWGMNVATISAIGAAIITCFQGWSFIKQGISIWKERSGESVSVVMFSYLFFYFIALIDYGIEMKKLTLLFNSMLCLCLVPVVAGLIRFKTFTFMERWCFGGSCFVPLCMLFAPRKESVFLILLFGILLVILLPPLEIRQFRSRGVSGLPVIVTGTISNVFWFSYGVKTGDLPLMIINPIAFVIGLITLWLWVKYPNTPSDVC